jgi:hypothetical protein
VQDILNSKCGPHHFALTPPRLAEGQSYDALIGRRSFSCRGLDQVQPGHPDGSCLVRRISGTDFGNQMPERQPALGNGEIDTIRSWVESLGE